MIHTTHITDDECKEIALSGATVGLCPSTEANLGDGIFPLKKYINYGGDFAIGSGSNTSINPIEELRWLEYGQRLNHQSRNISTNDDERHSGNFLFEKSLSGGAQALGQKIGKLEKNHRADILILDDDSAILAHTPDEYILDTLIFSGNVPVIKSVIVNGEHQIKNFRHTEEDKIKDSFLQTTEKIRSTLWN